MKPVIGSDLCLKASFKGICVDHDGLQFWLTWHLGNYIYELRDYLEQSNKKFILKMSTKEFSRPYFWVDLMGRSFTKINDPKKF